MRFHSDGPIIPDELLSQQKDGNVIFFCGAGLSIPAGLPSFDGLTKRIIEKLGSEKAKEPFERNEYDRAFNALVREFSSEEINRQLYLALKTPRKPDLKYHQFVLELSQGLDGEPQLVTTNFDLLFERARKKLRYSIPPALPNLELGQSLGGLVYLHGRLATPETGRLPNYVISSSDFGRAYLAEGWATQFIKNLRERYTIVLIGYQAEDPPMRYLLEGLSSRREGNYSYPLYAFAAGKHSDVEEEWVERGVTPIAYDNANGNHSCLWDTIEAWANAAKEPEIWNDKVLKLAQQKPTTLKSFERGQVTSMISNKEGAELFANASPPPSAEWLRVFDPFSRYAKPERVSWDNSEKIDPLDHYSVDDDPPRPLDDKNGRADAPGRDFLSWSSRDETYPDRIHLAAWDPRWSSRLPPRLEHLARWFQRIMHEPTAVWWAAGRRSFHPSLLWFVQQGIADKNRDLPGPARSFWNYFLEIQDRQLQIDHDLRWYELEDIVKREDWSGHATRTFERFTEPFVELKRHSLGASQPVHKNWDKIDLRQIVDLEVKVLDRHNHKIRISNDYLPRAVAIVRRSLERASVLLNEIGNPWWNAPNLHKTGDRGEHNYHGSKEQYFLWFKSLLDQLIKIDINAARNEYHQWNANEPYFFGKLAIYFALNKKIVTTAQAFRLFSKLPEKIFWDPYCQRELLFTLKGRWLEFSEKQRRTIERKIINGPKQWAGEEKDAYRSRRASYSASRLRWLQLNGRSLTRPSSIELRKLKAINPQWTDDWASNADDSFGPRGGYVEQVTEPQGLETLPINRIVDEAESMTTDRISELRDFRPFVGLVKEAPFKALAGLRLAYRKDKFPIRFWQNLLSGWPDETPRRLNWFLARTITKFPDEHALELKYHIPEWLKKQMPRLLKDDRKAAIEVFDEVVSPYINAQAEKIGSSMGQTTVGGVIQDRSEVSIDKAINSPAGKLTECLWSMIPRPRKGRGMPQYLDKRFQILFDLPGHAGGHAVAYVTQRTGWLDYWFKDWVKERILPLFSLDNDCSEAAWHGLAYDRNGLSRQTLKILTEPLVGVLTGKINWQLDEHEYRHHIRRMTHLSESDKKGKAVVAFGDANEILKAIDDLGRSEALTTLGNILETDDQKWRSFIKPFLENAWPRHTQYKGEKTSRAFANLADKTKTNFPEAVEVISPLVRSVSHLDMFAYRLSKNADEGDQNFAREYPKDTLTLLNALVGDDKLNIPYQLPQVLDIISETQPALKRTVAWKRMHDLIG